MEIMESPHQRLPVSTTGCLDRRQFFLTAGAVAWATSLAGRRGASAQVHAAETGIFRVTRGPADLVIPPRTPEEQVCRYGVGAPFQLSPTMAAMTCSLRIEKPPVGDFESGVDVILFDDLSRISAEHAIPVSRNEKYVHTSTGKPRIIVKYPLTGGFVPLGARRADGSPHPHAGTGFGLCEVLDFPMHGEWKTGYYRKEDKKKDMIRGTEVRQLAYDGKVLLVTETVRTTLENPPQAPDSEWKLIWPGLTWAIPDGDDLLYPTYAARGDATTWVPEPVASGVARWRRQDGRWHPITFVPVAHQEGAGMWAEPSLIRDTDGSLLFTARGAYGDFDNLVRVWRSADNGRTWDVLIDLPKARGQAPVTLNQAADGTPYIVANLPGHERDWLGLWPLQPDRKALGAMINVRNAVEDFGPPPSGLVWFMDHPSAATLRLADGKWHHVLTYRLMDRGEHSGGEPTPHTGQYVEEVISAGAARPPWKFGEA